MLTPSDRKLILHALSEEVPMFASLGDYQDAQQEIQALRKIAQQFRDVHRDYTRILLNRQEDSTDYALDAASEADALADKLIEQCRDFEDEHKRHTGEEIE